MSRRLAAILAADVVGYSSLMNADEAGTLDALNACRNELVEPAIAGHGGRVVKLMGDGLLAEFPSAVQAVECAAEIQRGIERRGRDEPEDRRLRMRIGVNIGDVIAEGDDIYGEGVNIAARLEALAEPGGVCISGTVYNHTRGKVGLGFEALGEKWLKNIADPVRVYRLASADVSGAGGLVPARRSGALRRLVGIAAGSAVLVAAGTLLWLEPWAPREEAASVAAMAFALPDKPSIAVLPFDNLSEDPAQEYFADGMTEDLITDLSKLSGLFVISRNSSFAYKGRAVKIRQVAEELGVRYVLEGSVRRVGDQVRINAQLIDATTGGHVWAERYDGTVDDVFRLQDSVTGEILSALSVKLTGEEVTQWARHGTNNAIAHDAFLRGWAHHRLLTPEDLEKAVPYFEEALRLDPSYSKANAALATVYWDAYRNDWAFDMGLASFQAEEKANVHLEMALKSPTPLAHALQARMMAFYGLHDLAVVEAEKAVALDGNDASSHAGLAEALIFADRPGEALGHIETAMRLDPHHPPSYLVTLGTVQFGMERFEVAAATFERAVTRNPDTEVPRIYLAATYSLLDRLTEAEATIETTNDLRARNGLGDLSLEPAGDAGYSPFTGEVEFGRFGGPANQKRLRAGLSKIPALSWQYRVKLTTRLSADNKFVPFYEIEGATEVDLATAKSLHDRDAKFIDESGEQVWRKAHIPGAIHLPFGRNYDDPSRLRLTEPTLQAVADPTEMLVFYYYFDPDWGTPWGPAKALAWGYEEVYYFVGGAPAWQAAGYTVEAAE